MIFVLLYQCFAGTLAWANYQILKRKGDVGWVIHSINGLLHLAAATLIGFYTKWNYGVASLLFTRIVFDTTLNVLRRKSVGYVSPFPDSVIDKAERWVIMRIVGIVHKKRTFIAKERIEWVAIYFRIVILIWGIIFLFI